MIKYSYLVFFIVVVSSGGCAATLNTLDKYTGGRVFHEEVIIKNSVNSVFTEEIISSSANLSSFLSKIYDADISNGPTYSIGEVPAKKKYKNGFHLDTEIFQSFCSSRNGEVYIWKSSFGILPSLFYVCEIGRELGPAIRLNGIRRNWYFLHFLSSLSVSEYMQQKITQYPNFIHYVGADGVLTLSRKYSGGYIFEINYTNQSGSTLNVNFLKTYVRVKGIDYLFNFGTKSVPFENFLGETVDIRNTNINPNENIKRSFVVKIGGLPDIFDESTISISIDEKITEQRFEKMTDYNRFKRKM